MHHSASAVTYDARAISDTIWLDSEKYQESDEYVAWQQALKEIVKRFKESLSKSDLQKLEEDKRLHFEAETSVQEDFQYSLSLTGIFNRAIDATRAVEQSYQATNRMMELYNKRIANLSQQMQNSK